MVLDSLGERSQRTFFWVYNISTVQRKTANKWVEASLIKSTEMKKERKKLGEHINTDSKAVFGLKILCWLPF